MTAIIGYVRQSTKMQLLGHSEQRQEDSLAAFVKTMKAEKAELWHDLYADHGKSGFKGHHHTKGDFGRLMRDVDAKTFPEGSILYFEDMSRFGRMDQRWVQNRWGQILDAGYRIAVNGKVYSKFTPQMELLEPIIRALLAHQESLNKSIWVRKAYAAKREAAKQGKRMTSGRNLPSWLLAGPNDTIVENHRADLVRLAFRLCIDEFGYKSICKELRRRGWNISLPTVQNLLTDGRAMGRFASTKEGESFDGYYPVVVDHDTFFAAQNAIASRRVIRGRRGNHVNVFKSLIFCENHNCSMMLRTSQHPKTKKPYRYLVSKASKEGTAALIQLPYDAVERVLLAYLEELDIDDLMSDSKTVAELKAVHGRIGWLADQITSATEDMSKVGYSSALAKQLATWEGEKIALQAKGQELEAKAHKPQIEGLKSLLARIGEGSDIRSKLAQAIRLIIGKITVKMVEDEDETGNRMSKNFLVSIYMVGSAEAARTLILDSKGNHLGGFVERPLEIFHRIHAAAG
jgi:DNA invertase Pin-like site-specific DNA recombinase